MYKENPKKNPFRNFFSRKGIKSEKLKVCRCSWLQRAKEHSCEQYLRHNFHSIMFHALQQIMAFPFFLFLVLPIAKRKKLPLENLENLFACSINFCIGANAHKRLPKKSGRDEQTLKCFMMLKSKNSLLFLPFCCSEIKNISHKSIIFLLFFVHKLEIIKEV